MLIQLKITASVRTRKDGLMEVRSNSFGSVYGRTTQELQEKLTKKLRESKKRTKQSQPMRKKSKRPTLANFTIRIIFRQKRTKSLQKVR